MVLRMWKPSPFNPVHGLGECSWYGDLLWPYTGPLCTVSFWLPPFNSRGHPCHVGAPRQRVLNLLDRLSPLLAKEGTLSVKCPNNLAWEIRLPRNPTGFFFVPQICYTGWTALLPFRRKACWGFLCPKKSDSFGRPEASMLTTRPPKPLLLLLTHTNNQQRIAPGFLWDSFKHWLIGW
jgi:hypothetical protein